MFELKGVQIVPITLHIGLGSLRPVDVEDITKYKIDSEYMSIDESATRLINYSLEHKKRVCAIGFSVVKATESSVSVSKRLKPTEQWTNTFIYPPYNFKICTSLLTNFHLPGSAPLMNAAAFGGYDLIMEAYQAAIQEKYRFFVYGDAMLII
ncbi:MAG: S-adenosylmethionine:tRNA ribosyltransferase-isomerase [Bacteroidota bacterium]